MCVSSTDITTGKVVTVPDTGVIVAHRCRFDGTIKTGTPQGCCKETLDVYTVEALIQMANESERLQKDLAETRQALADAAKGTGTI